MLSQADNSSRSRIGPLGWSLTIIALLLCLLLGSYLKMFAALDYEYEAFEKDPAFNYRLIEEFVDKGRLPDRDMLSLYPEGKETAKYLPTLLYAIGAGWVKAVRWAAPTVSFQESLLWFNALSSTLVAIPVLVMGWVLTRSRLAGILAASFVTVAPFIVFRGSADNMRAEMLGVTSGYFAVMFWVVALVDQGRRSALVYAACSGAALYIALGVWRMNIIVFVIMTLWHIFSIPKRTDGARAGRMYALLASGYFAAALFQPYLKFHHAIVSAESALAVAGLLVCASEWIQGKFPKAGSLKHHPYFRFAAGLLVLGLVLIFSHLADRTVGSAAASTFKLAIRFWGFPIGLTANDHLYEAAPELWPYDDVRSWFGPPVFSALAVVFLAAGAWKWPARFKSTEGSDFLKIFFWSAAFLSFLVAVRNLMIFIPAACILLGAASAARIYDCGDPLVYSARPWRPLRHLFLIFWIVLIAAGILVPVAQRINFVRDKPTVQRGAFQSDFRRTLAYIKSEIPENEPIASSWMMGYNLQTHARRPTITDGLFEVPEMRRRVRIEFGVFSSMDETEIVTYLREFKARWILVDRSYPIIAYQRSGKQGSPPDFILLHPEKLRRLRLELETKNLLLYRLAS